MSFTILFRTLPLAAILFIGLVAAGKAGDTVVASIKPLHSLVAAVMQGVGEPVLLVDGAASPHAFSLRPSQARTLQNARLVFWVGPGMETFLEKPVATLVGNATVVELINAPGLATLDYRDGGAPDTHIWLDPVNAKAMTRAIEAALSTADPANAPAYGANAAALLARLDRLTRDIAATLAPVKQRAFITFHDGYRYFDIRFGLNAAGSITLSPEVAPGAERIARIQRKIRDLNAVCVFAEPQFKPKLVAIATEGTDTRSGVLDPLGADLTPGPDLYFQLMRNMAASVRGCLSEGG